MIVLDGRVIKNKILEELKLEVDKLSTKPCFVVIQVGNNEASNVYVKQKEKMALTVGYDYRCIKLPEDITESDLLTKIYELNNDKHVHGILVQMPLPKHIDEKIIQNAVVPSKDIDGLCDINMGMLAHNKDTLVPCTPLGIMELLKRYNIEVANKNVVVVGRSNLVGRPMAEMFTNADATVTLCHSKTKNIKEFTSKADILVVAVGKPKIITNDMVREGSIVIDVGINQVDSKILGDVDFDNVSKKVNYITPVPGGVGQMTVAMLGFNVLKAYKLQTKE